MHGLLDPYLISGIGISEWMINFLYLINPVNPRSFLVGQKVFLARVTSCLVSVEVELVWASHVLSLVVNRLTSWFWWQTEVASVLGSVAVPFPYLMRLQTQDIGPPVVLCKPFHFKFRKSSMKWKHPNYGIFQLPFKKFSIIYQSQ